MKRQDHPGHYDAVAAEAGVNVEDVAKAYAGRLRMRGVLAAIREAAIALRLPEPPASEAKQ